MQHGTELSSMPILLMCSQTGTLDPIRCRCPHPTKKPERYGRANVAAGATKACSSVSMSMPFSSNRAWTSLTSRTNFPLASFSVTSLRLHSGWGVQGPRLHVMPSSVHEPDLVVVHLALDFSFPHIRTSHSGMALLNVSAGIISPAR